MSLKKAGGSSGSIEEGNTRLAALAAMVDVDGVTFTTWRSAVTVIASTDTLVVESGPIKRTRIRRLVIFNSGNQLTAGIRVLQLMRTTTAGTGGTPANTASSDASESFTGTVRTVPSVQGTAGQVLFSIPVFVPGANTNAPMVPIVIDMDLLGLAKSMTIPVGVQNGIVVRDPGATSGAAMALALIFSEEAT